ncbi:NAD-dependent epimerase/dehydratase family protein [Arthrobacter sp. UM1]|uniref:NAD-dependent epimerase/dehydratase family protein n=1 Tax=Arthrobacter sp. UM1 TaxID=2766776 RepID=UPI001CF6DEBE|nr:NAD-dependent epimerase/dehydratase family protein [Arthrobacter sp. UM1]MCB4207226.1 NAD-dependent epimerase/dehydratase family protein [Arthrobacter sp. UM1]
MIIGLLGASGFVGRHVRAEAERRGHTVLTAQAPRLDVPAPSGVGRAWKRASLAAWAGACAQELESLAGSEEAERLRLLGTESDVIVNAAGLASPEGHELSSLMGANALLPAMLAVQSGAPLLHLSSAAVLGAGTLHARPETAPFSDYSASKALGERLVREHGRMPACVLRATSVQGPERPTTQRFAAFARSRWAGCAEDAPTPLTSAASLARLVTGIAEDLAESRSVPETVLQPWEGATTLSAIRAARGHGSAVPMHIPRTLARLAVRAGHALGTALGSGAARGDGSGRAAHAAGRVGQRAAAVTRRAELLWFGQAQEDAWPRAAELAGAREVLDVLAQAGQAVSGGGTRGEQP